MTPRRSAPKLGGLFTTPVGSAAEAVDDEPPEQLAKPAVLDEAHPIAEEGEIPVEELLRRARVHPPYGEQVIEDLSVEESEAFLDALKVDAPAGREWRKPSEVTAAMPLDFSAPRRADPKSRKTALSLPLGVAAKLSAMSKATRLSQTELALLAVGEWDAHGAGDDSDAMLESHQPGRVTVHLYLSEAEADELKRRAGRVRLSVAHYVASTLRAAPEQLGALKDVTA